MQSNGPQGQSKTEKLTFAPSVFLRIEPLFLKCGKSVEGY